ncbi:hypothetical protein [Desulfonatronum lacustre]|uniref:hypothetical protein n=1 Tax=Desulfonatronum lacustre TaxID=66849 RepID=UPI00048FB1C2|nr:hypothetical protein [Desulfonatronum lacustre]
MEYDPTAGNAARLIHKALAPRPNPHRDDVYRGLLKLYAENTDFQLLVNNIAYGFELKVLYGTSYGLVLGAMSKDSRCSVRLTEINNYFSEVDKAALVICFAVVTMAFFPTAHDLEDPDFTPKPHLLDDILFHLKGFIDRFANKEKSDPESVDKIMKPGWRFLAELPDGEPDSKSGSKFTKSGLLQIVARFLRNYGFLEVDEEDGLVIYNATQRYKIHARELLFSEIFLWILDNSVEQSNH